MDEKSKQDQIVTTFNGQEMVSVFDGEKGYIVNPMTGSMEPVEMTPDQVKQTLRSSMFQNYMANYLQEWPTCTQW